MFADGRLRSREHTIDVLVTDAGQRQGLVAVRNLGRAGLRCGAVDSDASAPAFASRWCALSATVPDLVDDEDAFVDALLQICAELRPRVLIPVHDGSVEALRARRADLEEMVALALAPESALAVAVDKSRTLTVAQTVGLRAPRGAVVRSPDEAQAALADVGVPVVVKPTHTWVRRQGGGQRLRARVARTPEEAIEQIHGVLAEGSDLVLQEWLPGDREALSFMCAGERIWARFAQRADRTLPPLGGNSIMRESIPLPVDITAASERLVLELGLDGYSEVEFRRDASGRAALMEINPRLSASVELAVRAGVQFPELVYRWAAGEPLRASNDYRVGTRMRWLGGDLSWLEEALRWPGRPDVPQRGPAARAFLGDFVRPTGYDYLDRRDPRPALVAARGALRGLGSRATRFRREAARRRRGRRAGGDSDTDVAVIGAGPYGLALSAHLSERGVSHEILGEPMDTWRNHMPRGMYLKSEGFASNISDPARAYTLERYCAEHGIEYGPLAAPIALDTFVGYGDWFRKCAVPGLRVQRVGRMRMYDGGFRLQLDAGDTLRARRVVVASGMQGFAYLPGELGRLSSRRATHCFDYLEPERARGLDVAVLGAGQSALEAAALIHEHGGNVRVVSRRPYVAWNSKPGGSNRPLRERLRYPESGLGEGLEQRLCAEYPRAFHAAPRSLRERAAYGILGPAGSWWLRPRIEGKIEILMGRELSSVKEVDGGVCLGLRTPDGTEELVVDHVVAGTGYKPALGCLPFLGDGLCERIATVRGAPVLDRSFQSSVPDLYFVGYAAAVSFGPLMRFVYGTDFMARRLAGCLG